MLHYKEPSKSENEQVKAVLLDKKDQQKEKAQQQVIRLDVEQARGESKWND